jgi:hypothetical protein
VAEYQGEACGGAFDRPSQPFHGELDICRLKIAPAFDLGLISVFWEAADIDAPSIFY